MARVSSVESAASAVEHLLLDGSYRPGDRIPTERELASALGVSRPTIREALRRLTETGLLKARQGSGTYVADIDLEAIFAVRRQLEPYAASQAAHHRTHADVQALDDLLSTLSGSVGDPVAFAAIDHQIHRHLARAAGNQIILGFLDELSALSRLSRVVTSPHLVVRRATVRHMRRLVQAIREGDSATAAEAMSDHLENVWSVVRQADGVR